MTAHTAILIRLSSLVLMVLVLTITPAWAQDDGQQEDDEHHSDSRLSDEAKPLLAVPNRPRPILELGPKFLGTGPIPQGITLPGGAVWQPALSIFGNLRSAVQGTGVTSDDGDASLAEGVSRFDLFGNLYLSQTERIVIGFRPLDQDGQFTRYTLSSNPELPDTLSGFQDELNFGIRTLFMEGDLGEIFQAFDWGDSRRLDFGFSVGRQTLGFQDNLLMNDVIDAVGLTKANLKWFGLVNLRITGLYGWGDIDRTSGLVNRGDGSAQMFGLSTEWDTRKRTMELDAFYVSGDSLRGDGVYAALSSIQRFGRYSNTFRVLGSFPIGDESILGTNTQGVLIHNQTGWTPHHSHNWVYVNVFGGINQFRSAARAPSAGGPLGQTGVLFAAVGLGRYGAALRNTADYAVGGTIGYQMFFGPIDRKQLLLEVGGRYTYKDPNEDEFFLVQNAVAGGARYQIAVGRRGQLVFDGFGAYDLDASAVSFGGRFEVLIRL